MDSAATRRGHWRVRFAADSFLSIALACAVGTQAIAAQAVERHDVTFILGADRGGSGYFTAAADYFRSRARAEEEVVQGQRSLAAVREYLAQPGVHGAVPWGTIRLVAHGSQWYGLRVPVFDGDASDATLATMERAAASGAFPRLDADEGDAQTRIVIESCGIARRPKLMRAISALFFGNGIKPVVEASREYVAFRTWTDRGEEHSERVELPYASIVSVQTVANVSPTAEPRRRLNALWAAESGRPPPADLVVHEIPVEVRMPRLHSSASLHPLNRPGPLYDLGLRPGQFQWVTEGEEQVGRTHIVTLSPVADDWVRDARP